MDQKSSPQCCGGTELIFACSGAADVGEIADRAARKLTKDGTGRMFCLAGVAARKDGIMKTTETASKIVAIDGCSLDCVKKCLELAGFKKFAHLRVTDLGFEKGQAAVTDENVATVAQRGASFLS
jgi:uncharacterized metal-binding protein